MPLTLVNLAFRKDYSQVLNKVNRIIKSGLVDNKNYWRDPDSVFALQSGCSPTGVFANIAGAASPYTNVITGTQQFFRLMENQLAYPTESSNRAKRSSVYRK
jgi:hypothetical protein